MKLQVIDGMLAHMTKVAGSAVANSTTIKPLDSSSLLILDRSRNTPKVLMGRRHQNHKFMPGRFVFPGGSVEKNDSRMPVAGTLSARVEEALLKQVRRPSSNLCRSLALSAIRETFEETGLMVGSTQYGAPEAPADIAWQTFAEHGVFPEIDQLSFIARAITPPGPPKRFDTRFFVVDRHAIAGECEGLVGPDAELTELVWVPLKKAENYDMYGITRTIIEELLSRLENGMSEMLPVPFYHVRYGRAVRDSL